VDRFNVAHPRRAGDRLLARMVGVIAEDDRLAFSGPGALEIGNGVLRKHGRRDGAQDCKRENITKHRFPPVPA